MYRKSAEAQTATAEGGAAGEDVRWQTLDGGGLLDVADAALPVSSAF